VYAPVNGSTKFAWNLENGSNGTEFPALDILFFKLEVDRKPDALSCSRVFVDVNVALFENALMATQIVAIKIKMKIANEPLETLSGSRYFGVVRLPLLLLGGMRSLLSSLEFCGVVALDLRCFIDDIVV